MRTGTILLFACGWLAGCDESLLDQLTSGGGCSADDTVTGVIGRCPNEQLACELGWFDRDGVSANGCESTLQPSSEYSLFALDATGLVVMIINEYQMTASTTGGWVAIAGPACNAGPTTRCNYDLLALQSGMTGFTFDSLEWTDGLIELPKPMPVIDDGNGLIIPAGSTFVASFAIEGQKRVVSQGTTQTTHGAVRITPNGTRLTFTISPADLRLPFGGYTVEKMSIAVNGGLTAH
jgi:hypothetical protein